MPFIVQSDEKLPLVLVITDQLGLQLLEWLQSFFEAQNLQLLIIHPREYVATVAQIQQQDLWHYKTIVVTGFIPSLSQLIAGFQQSLEQPGRQETNTQEWLQVLQELKKSLIKPSFILGQYSLELRPSKQAFLQFLSQQQQQTKTLLEQAQELLPESQIIVGQDCSYQSITELQSRGEVEYPLLFSILCLENRVLINPQQSWFMQSLEDFFLAIGQQLLKPHQPGVIVVKGSELSSTEVLVVVAAQIETYFAYKPTTLPYSGATASSLIANVVCQTQTQIMPLIETQVRTIPHALLKLEELALWAVRFKINLRFEPHVLLSEHNTLQSSEILFEQTTPKPSVLQKELQSVTSATLITHPAEVTILPLSKPAKPSPMSTNELVISPVVHSPQQEQNKKLIDQSKSPLIPMNIEAEIQNLFGQNRQSKKEERIKNKAVVTQKIVSKSKRHKTVFYFGASLSVVGGVVLLLWMFFATTLHFTDQGWQKNLIALQENRSPETVRSFAGQLLDWQLKLYGFFIREDLLLEAKTTAALSSTTEQYQKLARELQQSTGSLLQQIVLGQGTSFETQLQQQNELISQQITVMENLLNQTKKLDESSFSAVDKTKAVDKLKSLDTEYKQLQAAGAVLKILPEILGQNTKQSWIVVVQDQQELRPTGGFIQAVGRLNFSEGLLTDSLFQSTYDLDARLSTKVAPPDEIKRFLGENNWYLRDSNWSPDFPTSAKQARFFMQEITGQEVDGVVGLTFDGVKKLLAITGPIDLPELNEQVSERNLYDRLEFHAETKTIVLNGKNVDYLSLILTKLMTKITQLTQPQLAELTLTLGQLALSKDLQLATFDATTAETWKQLGWNGGVIRPQCPSQLGTSQCLVDQLYQVDANIGINKVNPYIDKKVVDMVEVGESSVVHRRTITYKNLAKLESWPQGSYRAYVKFLLGKNAVIQNLLVDGVPVSPDQLLSYLEQDDQVIATPITVPRQKTVTVELRYRINHSHPAPFAYFFFNQKQPGSAETQDVLLSYQPALKPRLITPEADLSSQLLNFHFVRETQSFVGATFENTRK